MDVLRGMYQSLKGLTGACRQGVNRGHLRVMVAASGKAVPIAQKGPPGRPVAYALEKWEIPVLP